jgi:hypothetical protein
MEELRQITKPKKELGDTFRNYIKLAWYFEKGYEKLILIAIVLWGIYAVYRIFWVGC